MANICCDDVYFYSDTNPKGIKSLWADLTASIDLSPTGSWIGNLFQHKKIPTTGVCLRGTVTYMEQNEEGILLDLSTAWSPLYDAYRAVSSFYNVSFVCKSIEPEEDVYFNTDTTGRFFPEEYMITIHDEDEVTPLGRKVSEVLEDWAVYGSGQELLDSFQKLGYPASSVEELETLLSEQDIVIHAFENPQEI